MLDPQPNSSDVETLFHLLNRAHHQMLGMLQMEISKLDENQGLQPGMRHLFCALAHEDSLTISELATRLRMAKSSITGGLKRMELAGLVDLEPDPNDLRLRRAKLTKKGRVLKPACERIDAAISERINSEFSTEERQQIQELLNRLVNVMALPEKN